MISFVLAAGAIAIGSPVHQRSGSRAADCRHLPPVSVPTAIPNDNRRPAGVLRDGVLSVRLVARPAAWKPEGAAGCALAVHAFAEEGRAAQIPGPLMRVRLGTTIRATVRNGFAWPIWVRGLQDRAPGGVLDSTRLESGASHEFVFVPSVAGPRLYWASRSGSLTIAGDADGQLVGALVVDSAGAATGGTHEDRILVLTRWKSDGTSLNDGYQLNAINGLSWPHSERLRYTVGDSVHWQLVNASNAIHEMHLHGFYFRLEARGYQLDTVRPAPAPGVGDMRVTSVMRPNEWLAVSWSPDRTGNWLFHCHLVAHMNGEQRLAGMAGAVTRAGHPHDASEPAQGDHHGMAGLVMGLEVRPKRGRRAPLPFPDSARRRIDLYADVRPRVYGEHEGYGFVTRDGTSIPAQDSVRAPGAPLVLTRGEPVRIMVHNRLRQPISVHWHGIELESYNDGVGGFSGDAMRVAPPIAPADSFVVRMTPPRAGTFMYHVHGERGDELASGLYGPLLVIEPGTPAGLPNDRSVMITDGGPGARGPAFVNGSPTPDTTELIAGRTYRLRLLYLTSNHVVITTLRNAAGPVRMQRVAQDGYEQPLANLTLMRFGAGPGHTFDYTFTPADPGPMWLDVEYDPRSGVTGVRATTMPIRVRAP
jgi:manganese oxidase